MTDSQFDVYWELGTYSAACWLAYRANKVMSRSAKGDKKAQEVAVPMFLTLVGSVVYLGWNLKDVLRILFVWN